MLAGGRKQALQIVYQLAHQQHEFTPDDVRRALGDDVRSGSFIEAVFRRAAANGWCRPTSRYALSEWEGKWRPVRIWVSLLRP